MVRIILKRVMIWYGDVGRVCLTQNMGELRRTIHVNDHFGSINVGLFIPAGRLLE
jgi:hypothetical protein